MTEKSYFWDGTVRGDAKYAPYDIEAFTGILDKLTSVESGYVIPGLLNNLAITGTGTLSVFVETGAAIVRGYYYVGGQVALTSTINNTEYPRIDRIVLRLDYSTNTITPAILSGTPATLPNPPECRDIPGYIYEVPLGMYRIGAGANGFADTAVIDERKFYNTAQHSYTYPLQNIMPNSEFIGISGLGTTAPDMWTLSNSAVISLTTKFDQMARGVGIVISGAQNDGMNITLDTGTISTMHTLSTLVHVTSGTCSINFGGVTRLVYPTENPVVVTIRVATSGYQVLTVVGGTAGTNLFTIGQITLTQGYIQAPFVPRHETIFFNVSRAHIYYNGTFVSTGTVEYLSGQAFGSGFLQPGITGFIASLGGYDTGSSGAGPYYMSIQDPDTNADLLRIDFAGLPNSTPVSSTGIITMRYNQTTIVVDNMYTHQVAFAASGANTMNVTIQLYGIIV